MKDQRRNRAAYFIEIDGGVEFFIGVGKALVVRHVIIGQSFSANGEALAQRMSVLTLRKMSIIFTGYGSPPTMVSRK